MNAYFDSDVQYQYECRHYVELGLHIVVMTNYHLYAGEFGLAGHGPHKVERVKVLALLAIYILLRIFT